MIHVRIAGTGRVGSAKRIVLRPQPGGGDALKRVLTERGWSVVAVVIELPALLSGVDGGQRWLEGRKRCRRRWRHRSHRGLLITRVLARASIGSRNVHSASSLGLPDGALAQEKVIVMLMSSSSRGDGGRRG